MMNMEERIYEMMMDALDGQLADNDRLELEAHLRARPDLAREWRLLQSVDALLRQTPPLSPAAGFAERTLARLPHSRQRVWALTTAYLILLVAGLLPLGAIIWFVAMFGEALVRPSLWRGVAQMLAVVLRVGQTALAGMWQVFLALGQRAGEQPGMWGWLFVMVGMIVLWRGVYQQVMQQPQTDWVD
ncbi:MAG: hypothetical protein KC418_22490 [Anaerolineales bacterium]|nr:hypothetical protein [Anaerolineales bacterium]MCB8950993.1 hypothetical protein [Ardenticatenales bacterium]